MHDSGFVAQRELPTGEQANPVRILVVEDDVDIQQVLCVYLRHSGFKVQAAFDGAQAIEAIPTFRPALIVLDLMMHPVNGWEVLHWLQQRRQTAPPVLILTALTRLEDQVRGFEAGALDYLTKPTQPRVIVERIRTLLALSHEQQANLQRERAEQQRRTLELISSPQPDEFLY